MGRLCRLPHLATTSHATVTHPVRSHAVSERPCPSALPHVFALDPTPSPLRLLRCRSLPCHATRVRLNNARSNRASRRSPGSSRLYSALTEPHGTSWASATSGTLTSVSLHRSTLRLSSAGLSVRATLKALRPRPCGCRTVHCRPIASQVPGSRSTAHLIRSSHGPATVTLTSRLASLWMLPCR
jgi:hypothetical protein